MIRIARLTAEAAILMAVWSAVAVITALSALASTPVSFGVLPASVTVTAGHCGTSQQHVTVTHGKVVTSCL
jgi:hypothetical protein